MCSKNTQQVNKSRGFKAKEDVYKVYCGNVHSNVDFFYNLGIMMLLSSGMLNKMRRKSGDRVHNLIPTA